MSELQQEGAPAVASDDPANLEGPGVTQQPDNAAAVFDLAAVAEENARLRSELIAENERLKAALADSRLAGAELQGLSDDDVRRLEHPEEFTEEYAARGENEQLKAQVEELHRLFVQSERARSAEAAQQAQVQTTGTPLDQLSNDELTAELERRRNQH